MQKDENPKDNLSPLKTQQLNFGSTSKNLQVQVVQTIVIPTSST